MSIVACRVYEDRITIASDSIVVYEDTQRKSDMGNDEFCKLTRINGMIIGSVGTCEEGMLFQLYCSTRKPKSPTVDDVMAFVVEFAQWKKKMTELSYSLDNKHILIFNKTAFYIERFFVDCIRDYRAIGAGKDFALSALYLGHTVREAVEAACELSIYCERPINLIEERR